MTRPRSPRALRAGRLVALACLLLAGLGLGRAIAPPAARATGPVPPSLDVRAAALLDADTGQLLYGDNAQSERAIASTTKLMTALVTLEQVPLDQVFTEPDFYFSPEDSQIGLLPGERMTVHDLLLALMLPSADDAAADLAANIGHGQISRFVALMNARAHQLGLSHTHYTTPSGLDTPGNYSSAADLVRLAAYDLAHEPFLRRAVALSGARLASGRVPRSIRNLNDLVGRYPWINGVKTGHTLDAGYVLVVSGTRDGTTLIGAVLGTPSESVRDATALALLNWGFASFQLRTPVTAGEAVPGPAIRYRRRERAAVVAASTVRRMYARGTVLSTRVLERRMLTGPLPRGSRVGTLIVAADGRPVARVALVLARALPKISPPGVSLAGLAAPITLVCGALLLLAAGGVRRFGRLRRRARAAEGRTRR
jgi:D-alanyl-D-alanine carboxypeptidase (penicillin-binding protein 5/6)